MKKLFIINDTLTNKISYFHLLLFLVTLPFDRFYSQLVLVSLLLHTLVHLKEFNLKKIFTWNVLLLQSVFYLTLLGAIYTSDRSLAFHDLEKQLAIFLFPILLIINPLDLSKYRKQLLYIFALTCTLTILYLYFDALRIISFNGLSFNSLFTPVFLNHNFSEPIDIHASYLALYVAIALVSLIETFADRPNPVQRIFILTCMLVLLAGLIQLGSRSIFISFLFILVAIVPFIYTKKLKSHIPAYAGLFIAGLLILLVFKNDVLNDRYVKDLRSDIKNDLSAYKVTDPRAVRWAAAVDLVKKEPLLGYGSGIETELLKEEYYERKLYHSFLHNLNAHNQYLSFLVKYGIIGLLVYLFTLLAGFIHAIKNRDIVFLSFFVLLGITSIGENYLDVNKGIFFYSFFFSFFLLTGFRKAHAEEATRE